MQIGASKYGISEIDVLNRNLPIFKLASTLKFCEEVCPAQIWCKVFLVAKPVPSLYPTQ